MTHFLCSWIYITKPESFYQTARKPLKANEGRGADENPDKQFFTSTEHQEGRCQNTKGLPKITASSDGLIGQLVIWFSEPF